MGCKEKGLRATRLTVGASNDLQMERNLTGGLPVIYQGHTANLDPFRERFSPTHETRSEGDDGASGSVGSRNGQQGERPDASFEKHADEMQMMTWQSATRKQMTWQQRRITGRHLAHGIRGVTASLCEGPIFYFSVFTFMQRFKVFLSIPFYFSLLASIMW